MKLKKTLTRIAKLKIKKDTRKRIYLNIAILSMLLNSFYPFLASYQYVYAEDKEAVVEEISSSEDKSDGAEEYSKPKETTSEEAANVSEGESEAAQTEPTDQVLGISTEDQNATQTDTGTEGVAETQPVVDGAQLPDGASDSRPVGSEHASEIIPVTDTTNQDLDQLSVYRLSHVADGLGSCPMTGAIWTTDSNCTVTNQNIYFSKSEVYLNGGPAGNGGGPGLPDGNYYVRVTDPSGKAILGESNEPSVTVSGGVFKECYKLQNVVGYDSTSGFKDTTNPGGEYKVWVSPDKNFKDCSKTDNFKVLEKGFCGDGNVNAQNEQCDDGNRDNNDYCSNTCQFNSVCIPDVNMLVNGDFETPEVTSHYKWDIFNMYSPMLGWNVVWNGGSASYSGQTRPEPAYLELHRDVNGWSSASGSQYAELDTDWDGPGNPLNNEPATVGISQEIPLIDGYKYKVKFSYSPRPGTDASNNVMDFAWDGTTVDTYSGAGGGNTSWTPKSYEFVAGKTAITNVAFVEKGTADSLGMFLDNVSVTCLGPEIIPKCGDGLLNQTTEECDGTSGVTLGKNFCTYNCKLVPIYDGAHTCSEGKYPVAYSGPFTISSTDGDGITIPVVGGKEYLFKVSGTFVPTGASGYISDAGYTLINGVLANQYGIKGTPPDLGTHALLGNFGEGVGIVDWGNYNSEHIYTKAYTFDNNDNNYDINFLIGDRYDNWFNTAWNNQDGMKDNSGNLSLTVYECATPVCGNGQREFGEECDGTDGIKSGENFCTPTCKLIPLYDGEHMCAPGTTPVKVGDTYVIDSKDSDGVTVPLIGGQEYLFKVSGTYKFGAPNDNRVADAAYGSENSWTSVRTDLGIWGSSLRGVLSLLGNLGMGIGVIEWDNDSIFDQDHAYEKVFTPASDMSAQFLISDWYSNWYENTCKNQSCMSDNKGSLSLEVYECQPSSNVTVCKYDSKNKPLTGWNVSLKGDLVGTLNVLPNGSDYNSAGLPVGDYVLEASGYYTYRPGTAGAEYTDANYSKRHPSDPVYGGPYIPWVNVNSFPSPHTGWLGVMVNGAPTNWSDYYASDHKYLLGFENYSGPFSFKILDDVYTDNSGSITVNIYKGYAGVTGEDGCVTFKDVPLGDYRLDETLKDGWVNLNETRGKRVSVDGQEDRFTLVNEDLSDVGLDISKTNLNWPDQLQSGDIVTYQITIRAVGGPLFDVFVVDLPPTGFVPGNFQTSASIEGLPTYASPGKWHIGDMEEGDEIVLTYDAVVGSDVDPGVYPDLAWAYGSNIIGGKIIANSKESGFAVNNGIVNETFVGTQVEVVRENESPKVKTEVDEKTVEEGVLGASTARLPATGQNVVILISVLALMLTGTLIMALSRKKKILKILPILFLAAALYGGMDSVLAANLSVRIEDPKSPVNSPFQVTFVVLNADPNEGDLHYQCWIDGPTSGWEKLGSEGTLPNEGGTDVCDVTESVLTSDGLYSIKVVVEGVESATVSTTYDNTPPSKPKYIEVDRKSACKYEIEFKTANDGQTSYVEVYMSDDKEFTAGSGSRIRTITIGPDQKYKFTEEVAGDKCAHRQYFAVRAFDSAGNGSKVEAEEVTDIEYKTIYKEGTEEVTQEAYAGGAASSIGAGAGEEGAEVVTSEEEMPSEEGSILGEQAQAETGAEKGFFGKLISSPWTWIILILALGIITINGIRKSKKE